MYVASFVKNLLFANQIDVGVIGGWRNDPLKWFVFTITLQILNIQHVLLQLLTIHLDESDVFSAWVSAKELGFTPSSESVDTKCKLTRIVKFYNIYDFKNKSELSLLRSYQNI